MIDHYSFILGIYVGMLIVLVGSLIGIIVVSKFWE